VADTGRVEDTEQGELPVFTYRPADATIKGIEAALDVAPLEWLKLGLAYTLLDTRNEETGTLLPQTPPDRLLARLRLERSRWGPSSRALFGLEVSFVEKGEVSGPDEPFGTPTDPYTLTDLTAGVEWALGETTLALDLTVRNLFDTEYTDFLWSYKAFAPNPGRDVRVAARFVF